MRIPRQLQPGDTIGIFSPSSPIESKAVNTMCKYFEQRGYTVNVAPNTLATFGFMAGSPQQRADDLNLLLHDPTVRMVMTSTGGAGAVHLLPLIDYPALAADPKIVVGLSDPSILLLALTSATGVPTFHGPNGVEFGGLCPLTTFTEENFWPMLTGEFSLPYSFPVQEHFQVLRSGKSVEGTLIGGNLERLSLLIGTPWEPDWQGAVLFVEEFLSKDTSFDALLAHLHLSGVFEKICCLLVGKPVQMEGYEQDGVTLEEIILRNCAGYDFPIVSDLLIGHTDDKLTLPIGCRVGLDTGRGLLELYDLPGTG